MITCSYNISNAPCVITDGPAAYCVDAAYNPLCLGCGGTPAETGVPVPDDFEARVNAMIERDHERDMTPTPRRERFHWTDDDQ